MQELLDEMNRRIGTLERQVGHCEGQREQLLTQAAGYDQQIKEAEALAAQYREALQRLAMSVTYRGPYSREPQ